MTLIYGIGGMGREAAQCVRDLAQLARDDYSLDGFIDDHASGRTVHGVPVLTLDEAVRTFPGADVVVAVGDGAVRERLAARIVAAGLCEVTIIHPSAIVGDGVALGLGSYVAPGAILTCDLTLGREVQVNVGVTVHHDCAVDDFVTLSPRVTLCGGVRVERGAFLGAGAVVRQGLTIGAGACVGMGAVVTKDVPPGETWVGNPAHQR